MYGSLERFMEALEAGSVKAFSISTVEEGGLIGQYYRIGGQFAALIGAIEASKHDLLQDAHIDDE